MDKRVIFFENLIFFGLSYLGNAILSNFYAILSGSRTVIITS